MTDSPPSGSGVEWKVLALQLFVLPLAIVAACVGIFLLFGRLAHEDRDAPSLLAEIRRHDGGRLEVWDGNARWRAAFELPDRVRRDREALRRDPAFCRDLVSLFEDPRYPDPAIRAVLARALGELGDPQAVPALRQGLKDASEDAAIVRHACAQALGALQAHEAAPDLAGLLKDPEPALRKVAVYALANLGDGEALEAIRPALEDPGAGVRWSAAVALGLKGESRASPALAPFLDRGAVEGDAGIEAGERDTVLAGAARAAGALRDPALKPALEALRKDPSRPVALAAQEALIAYGRAK